MNEFEDHRPVLLDEVIEALDPVSDGLYMDATFGRGGHTQALLDRLGPQGRVIAIDRDPTAIAYGEKKYQHEPRLELVHGNFSQVREMLEQRGLEKSFDGVMADLGVSSPQLDDAARGFSFMQDGPLDMRMDTSRGPSAAEWLATAEEYDITRVLREYGEEKFARRISAAIVAVRDESPIETTAQLVKIIEQATPVRDKHKHPATRSFQAIRMQINQELQSIDEGLESMLDALKPGGRLAVISFHSLEDRLVKRFMKSKVSRPQIPKGLPVFDSDMEVPYALVGKPQVSGQQELASNPRARSARLRVMQRKP